MSSSSLSRLAGILFIFLTGSAVFAQDQPSHTPLPPTQTAPRHLFFAGTITELDDQRITVSRSVVGRAPEHHTFLIKPETKMNKSALKLKSRVTVRYQHNPDGDVALEIQIRPPAHTTKSS